MLCDQMICNTTRTALRPPIVLLQRPITVDLRCGKSPVAAGSREVGMNKESERSQEWRWKTVNASVFSTSNQPSLPLHLSLSSTKSASTASYTLLGRAFTHTHSGSQAHAHTKREQKIIVHRCKCPFALTWRIICVRQWQWN